MSAENTCSSETKDRHDAQLCRSGDQSRKTGICSLTFTYDSKDVAEVRSTLRWACEEKSRQGAVALITCGAGEQLVQRGCRESQMDGKLELAGHALLLL